MSTPPPDPPRVMGGLKLPPIPEIEEDATFRPAPVEVVAQPRGGSILLLMFASVLAGLAGGALATYSLYQTNIAPALIARAELDASLQRIQTQQRDLEGQLEAIRTQQLTLDQKMQEVRQVVAQITIQTTNELTAARDQAAKAKQELGNLKIEGDLTQLNRNFDQSQLPIAIREATQREKTLELTVEYWGFRVTEREALSYLAQAKGELQKIFPRYRLPEDYVVTFHSVQNGSSTIYRHGLWDAGHRGGGE